MKTRARAWLILAAVAVLTTNLLAQPTVPPAVRYSLQPGSTYEEGCYNQCLCPIIQAPLAGTFDLEFLPTGSPLDTYAVGDVDLQVSALELQIVGSGFYVRGGEFNQLELDLQLDGNPAMHFSSFGLVPAGAEFPDIDIVVSVNQMLECYDYVLHLVAMPDTTPCPVLSVGASELAWCAVAGASAYDVVCGNLNSLHDSGGDLGGSTDRCLGDAYPHTTIAYDIPLDAGQGLWFLVREDGGTYDSTGDSQVASRDAAIDNSATACP